MEDKLFNELVNYIDWVLISDGDNNKVYKATYLPFNIIRIVKVINKNESGNETYHNEINIMSRINHRFIPHIYEAGELDNFYYIVMEYIEGVTLLEYMRLHGTTDIRNIIIKLCHIVEFLHNLSEPILVLDIQPTNIIIKNDEIYLIDFGNSKRIETVDKREKRRRKFHFGTIGFAGPEQFGLKEVSRGTDIYAIGKLILEFSDDEELREIAYRCIGIDASCRYETVSSLIKDLNEVCFNKTNSSKNCMEISVFGIKEGVGVTTFAIGLVIALRKEGYSAFYIPRDPSVIDNLRNNCEVSYEERRENGYIVRAYYLGSLAMAYDGAIEFVARDNKIVKSVKSLKSVIYVYDCGRYRRKRYYKGTKCVIFNAASWSGEVISPIRKLTRIQSTLNIYNQCGINAYRKAELRNGITGIRMPFVTDIMESAEDKEATKFYKKVIGKILRETV